jgi:hypothetical protein
MKEIPLEQVKAASKGILFTPEQLRCGAAPL